jgi:hypothetical protein
MTEVVLNVITTYKIDENLGYFILDNTSFNDTAVRGILRPFNLTDQYLRRHLRCLGHMINHSAQFFLFGQDEKAFEIDEFEEIESAYEL